MGVELTERSSKNKTHTYHITMLGKALQFSSRNLRTFGRGRDRFGIRVHNPHFPNGYVPNYMRFAVWLSFYLGTTFTTHCIHSGTQAKYRDIRNTEMYFLQHGCPIKEGYKNWEE